MARKKAEPITSLGKSDDKLTVQKSLSLFALWQSDLTLAEFKILDIYLSRINSHNPDQREVVFEKGELEKVLGIKKINKTDLEARLKHLLNQVVVLDREDKKGFKLVALFEYAEADQDDYGIWQVKLECTQKAMKYFFNIETLGYLRYKLRCVTSITSRYTYIMFSYLEHNRYRKTWEVDLNELRKILDCDKEELYKEFKYFNRDILKKVQNEMHEKTECQFDYEPIKKGRTVVAIRFTVHSLSHLEAVEPDNQMTIAEWEEDLETHKETELWQTPLEIFNFSPEQYDELFALLITIPDSKLPEASACPGSIDLMRYHYLDQKAKEIIRRDKEKPIRSKFNYLIKIIKQDISN